MAAPSALVFKVPELAQMGYALDKQAQAEREKEEAKREQFSKSLGVESKMLEGGYKLSGQFLEGTQQAFNVWKEASVEYERTGADDAKAKLEAATAQFNQMFGVGLGASNSLSKEIQSFRAVGGSGYLQNLSEVNTSRDAFLSPKEYKVENGVVMIKEGSEWKPAANSETFSTTPNNSNTFSLERVNPKLAGYNPLLIGDQMSRDIWASDGVMRIGSNGSRSFNDEKAKEKVLSDLAMRRETNSEEERRMIATWWYSQKNGKEQGSLSQTDAAWIETNMSSEAFMTAAIENYNNAVVEAVLSKKPAGQAGTARQPSQAETTAAGIAQQGVLGGASSDGIMYSFGADAITLGGENNIIITGVQYNKSGDVIGFNAFKKAASDPWSFGGGSSSNESFTISSGDANWNSAMAKLRGSGWHNVFQQTTKGRSGQMAIESMGG